MNNFINENILKLFYVLFLVDIVVGILLFVFVSHLLGIITVFTLLFINFVTFVVIKKIIKVQQNQKDIKE